MTHEEMGPAPSDYCPDCREYRKVVENRKTHYFDPEGSALRSLKFECGHAIQVS